jgi:small subunit ribosomal protein S30
LCGFFRKTFDLKSSQIDPKFRDRIITSGLVNQVNRILINALGADHFHLSELDVDIDPRHEAFWFIGGIKPPESVRKMREGIDWYKKYANDPVDRTLQYIGKPHLALRHQFPLEAIDGASFEGRDVEEGKSAIPSFKFDPQTLGFSKVHRHGESLRSSINSIIKWSIF